jgi:hypothetical protein
MEHGGSYQSVFQNGFKSRLTSERVHIGLTDSLILFDFKRPHAPGVLFVIDDQWFRVREILFV